MGGGRGRRERGRFYEAYEVKIKGKNCCLLLRRKKKISILYITLWLWSKKIINAPLFTTDKFTARPAAGIKVRTRRVSQLLAREIQKVKPHVWGWVQGRNLWLTEEEQHLVLQLRADSRVERIYMHHDTMMQLPTFTSSCTHARQPCEWSALKSSYFQAPVEKFITLLIRKFTASSVLTWLEFLERIIVEIGNHD